ncbi:MAG TPA: bacteriophage holin [Ignavibacteriaceae bacterium]|jgi:fructose-specific phosphotransferase system IIC component|nr:bacteriophage holin [Ignavibacteriaceae bacterium]
MELRKRALGIAVGFVWGLSVLVVTWWLLIRGAPGEIVSKLSTLYLGYSYSWGGSIIGFLWGFVDGFIGGFLIAWIYNIVNKLIPKTKTA